MNVCYNKVFKLLINKNMKKDCLCEIASADTLSLVKLKDGENVNTNTLVRIRHALKCELGEVMNYLTRNRGEYNDA